MRKYFISRTVIAALIVMLLLLNGCNNVEDSDMTSTESDLYSDTMSEILVESTNLTSIYDPTCRPFCNMPPETKAMQESFEYVIFAEVDYPTVLNLPVHVEDYISEKNDFLFFDMDLVASDYGWKQTTSSREEDGKTVEYTYYYYDCGEMWVYLEFEFLADDHTDGVMRDCLGRIKYAFIYPNEPEHYFYDPNNEFATSTNNSYVFLIRNVMKQELYQVQEEKDLYAYEDETILMTYVFSFVSRYPEYNPFCFEEFRQWRYCDYYPISNDYPWDKYEVA